MQITKIEYKDVYDKNKKLYTYLQQSKIAIEKLI